MLVPGADDVLRSDPVPWSAAMERALYGPDGFYVAGAGAAGHFRTSATASPAVRAIFAEALAELLTRVDAALGRPDPLDLVDVGAGSGGLLDDVLDALGSRLRGRVRPVAVELRPRPVGLSARVRWLDAVPATTGLLFANEWLDNVPIEVVVAGGVGVSGLGGGRVGGDPSGPRLLLVDRAGVESAGPALGPEEAAWLARWWPTGARRELGLGRDRAWAGAVSRVLRGLAVAIDYAHLAGERPPYGTLTGFRLGHGTEPVPDASCDLTAHVAMDSVAVAGEDAAVARGRSVRTLCTNQRTALRCLGVGGRRPDYAADPRGYAGALQRASDSAELIDPAGLGAFTWLLHGIDLDLDLDPTALLA